MVPIVSVNAITYVNTETTATPGVNSDLGGYGDTHSVKGAGLTSGYTVELYWDSVKAWDGEAGLLNSTTADPDGTYDIWFDVPEALAGNHYLWVKDATTGDTAVSAFFVVAPAVDSESSSGLPDDEYDVDIYGFGDEENVVVLLGDATGTYPPVTDANNIVAVELLATTDAGGDLTNHAGTLVNVPVKPGSVVVSSAGAAGTPWDDADTPGILETAGGADVGTINYLTGAVELDITDTTAPVAINVAYEHYANDDQDDVYVFETELETTELGSASLEITVPAQAEMAASVTPYTLCAFNADGDVGQVDFTIGPVITLSVARSNWNYCYSRRSWFPQHTDC